jgi:hypothetical protein
LQLHRGIHLELEHVFWSDDSDAHTAVGVTLGFQQRWCLTDSRLLKTNCTLTCAICPCMSTKVKHLHSWVEF